MSTLAPPLREPSCLRGALSQYVYANRPRHLHPVPKIYGLGCIIHLVFRGMVMPDPACQHKRTQLIAKDDDTQYVECLDCGEIFEIGELNDGSGSGESLSDA